MRLWGLPTQTCFILSCPCSRCQRLVCHSSVCTARSLSPGFTVLSNAAGAAGLIEMKIETIWGRAYLGWPWLVHPIIRGPMPHGAVGIDHTNYTLYGGGVLDNQGVRCAWRLAEHVACLVGADEVRVDVLIRMGEPGVAEGCLINKVSLTSGAYYGYHTHHAAELWRQGHERKQFKRRQSLAAVPVYEQVYNGTECTQIECSAFLAGGCQLLV